MEIKACIFDLDGVIVDTAKYHFLAWKRLAEMLGIEFTEKDNERLKGVSRMESLEIILELGGLKIGNDLKMEYASLKNRWYVEYIEKMTPAELLPGSAKFIKELRKNGIRVAVGSASKNTPLILKRVKIRDLFDAVADGNVTKKAKPDPEVFLKAADMVKINPSQCVVFEDAIAGIEAALNAGMRCIGIGSPELLVKAHKVISGLDEMDIKELRKFESEIRL